MNLMILKYKLVSLVFFIKILICYCQKIVGRVHIVTKDKKNVFMHFRVYDSASNVFLYSCMKDEKVSQLNKINKKTR